MIFLLFVLWNIYDDHDRTTAMNLSEFIDEDNTTFQPFDINDAADQWLDYYGGWKKS